MAGNLLVTEGLGDSNESFSFSSVIPSLAGVSVHFTDTPALTGASLLAANWSITPLLGAEPVTILSVSVVGTDIAIVTTEHEDGGSYTLNMPQGVISLDTGNPFSGPFTFDYTGVGQLPELVMARWIDARSLDVVFSEQVRADEALDVANWSISGSDAVSVVSVTKQTNQSFKLTTTRMSKSSSYSVTAINIRDIGGNAV